MPSDLKLNARMLDDQHAVVTFICPNSQMVIRLTDNSTRGVCEAARTLKARYFVYECCWYTGLEPVLGVFDMRTAQKNNPVPGEWMLGDPIRTFPINAREAAAMWAMAQGAK